MSDRFPKIIAIAGAIAFLPFGVLAMVAPETFYDQFAVFEPYNQHFIQDLGAFQIGLGAVLLLAVFRPAWASMTVALLGTGIGGAAHAVSHVVGRDLGGKPASDIPLFVTIAVLLLAAGIWQHRSEA
jgi:hypothetical protein